MSEPRQEVAGKAGGASFPFMFNMFYPTAVNRAALNPAWNAIGAMLQRVEPFGRSVTSAQMASMSFVGQRTRANLDLASRLAGCRSPQDVASAQARYWQDASRDYMAFTSHWISLWQRALASDLAGAVGGTTTEGGSAPRARDLIWLPDAPSASGPTEKPKDDARRAA